MNNAMLEQILVTEALRERDATAERERDAESHTDSEKQAAEPQADVYTGLRPAASTRSERCRTDSSQVEANAASSWLFAMSIYLCNVCAGAADLSGQSLPSCPCRQVLNLCFVQNCPLLPDAHGFSISTPATQDSGFP